MSINERRLRAALQGFVTKVRDERIYGTLGRVNADASVTVAVAERPDHVYIRIGSPQGAGALITLPNVGKGRVPLRANLPVQMIRLNNGELALDGQDDRLLEDDPYAPDASGVPLHGHAIDELTDVVITTPGPNEVISYNGTNWINSFLRIPNKTPLSATDTAVAGEMCYDANYLYVAVADNQWTRVALIW